MILLVFGLFFSSFEDGISPEYGCMQGSSVFSCPLRCNFWQVTDTGAVEVHRGTASVFDALIALRFHESGTSVDG